MPNCDVILVTAENYPSLFKAFEAISHDNGNQAGHTNYTISMKWQEKIALVEQCLNYLLTDRDSDFTTITIGEDSERKALVKQYIPGISYTDDLLQEFFEEL